MSHKPIANQFTGPQCGAVFSLTTLFQTAERYARRLYSKGEATSLRKTFVAQRAGMVRALRSYPCGANTEEEARYWERLSQQTVERGYDGVAAIRPIFGKNDRMPGEHQFIGLMILFWSRQDIARRAMMFVEKEDPNGREFGPLFSCSLFD